ncbi:N-acetylmuramoyl-L-alanine amidase [Trujillonella humicola]|uniref:N-acetylmuramoyl-L-alanine amidase n=1 Tax=Trujillonella humicola TaxID=3383699 RepID=UPI0039063C6D
MRRLLAGTLASVAFTGTFLVLPVYADPAPEAVPVEASTEEIALGSAADPAPAAEVQQGTTEPVAGVGAQAPALTVSRTGVAEFSMVGVHWAYDPAVTDTVVQIRVQDAGGAWGEWTEVGVEDAAPDADGEVPAGWRGSAAPLWTGPSTGVEVELVTRSGAAPTDVQLTLVDPGTSPADGALGAPEIQDTADAAMAMPDVYSRAQWGADESKRTWAPEYAPTIKAATLHHTASSNTYTADQVPAILRGFYQLHAVTNGWGDIGYNVLVDKFGRRWEGRSGGLASTVVGAHAGGFNTGTFGVSMIGNYDTAATPQVMVDSVAAIIAWKFSLYGVDPRGTTTLTSGGGTTVRYARGTTVTLPTIFGHRDTGLTACPGQYGYARLPEIRDKVAAALSNVETISTRYAADAGLRAVLGAPVGSQQSSGLMRWQAYQHGYLVDSPAGGVRYVKGAILARWLAGDARTVLGAPTTDEICLAGGCLNLFERGGIYWTPQGGTTLVKGAIFDRYRVAGGPSGSLGWPTSEEICGPGGCSVAFTGGEIAWSPPGGARLVRGAIRERWQALGHAGGVLGWPTGDETCVSGGCFSYFTGGALSWTPSTGTGLTKGAIAQRWRQLGGATGSLGLALGDEQCVAGGCLSRFTGGVVSWSPVHGTHWIGADLLPAVERAGGVSALGLLTSDPVTLRGGGFVALERGSVYWSPATGARVVKGAIRDRWGQEGWEHGYLGYPVTDETCVPGGCSVRFQGGSISWSPAGGTQVVKGAILERWLALGGETGPLGFPTSSEVCVPGGCSTTFQRGSVHWSPASGTRWMDDRMTAAYQRAGGPAVLGFPVADQLPLDAGAYVVLARGAIYRTTAGEAFLVKGAIRERWAAQNWENGPLGYPVSDEVCVPGGCFNRFQGGAVLWSPAGGVRVVTGPWLAAYEAAGGPAGALGFPVSDVRGSGVGARQDMQRGHLLMTAPNRVEVR